MTTTQHEAYLAQELENFQEIAQALKPASGGVPELDGVDICSVSMALNGVIGGDHLIYLDFKTRYDLKRRIREAEEKGRDEVAENLRRLEHRAGILVADVSGHRVTDALIAAMLHQAFLLGRTTSSIDLVKSPPSSSSTSINVSTKPPTSTNI